jgi:putative hemolysin
LDLDGSSGHLFYLIVIAVSALLIVFSSFAESSLVGLSRARVQRVSERDPATGRVLLEFVDRSTVYVGAVELTRIAALIAAAVATVGATSSAVAPWTSVLDAVVVLCFALVFGWIAPRAVATSRSEQFVATFAWPLRALTWLLTPIISLVGGGTERLARIVGGVELSEAPVVTTEELKDMVAASEEEGLIEERERTMIDNILGLEDVLVREVMVPRPDVVAANASLTVREAVDLFIRERYSRLPVYRESIDDIAGILYARDLFEVVVERRFDERVDGLVRPAYFVPESKRCDDLLRDLQQQRVHIAIVVDEYGGTAGIVTIEDLLEEIVGEIQDEFDTEEQKIVANGDGSAIVVGSASIDDVNEELDLSLETEEVDTIGGLVYEKLGRVPAVGDQVRVDGALLTVVGAHRRRVTRVRVERQPAEATNWPTTKNKPGAD